MEAQETLDAVKRFRFGKNWQTFLETVDEQAIADSMQALVAMLGMESLKGKSFLDIGSGSGLSSLAAYRLGAKVTSFDYDAESVECTRTLQERYCKDGELWRVQQGSILDGQLVERLGTHDIVYSWGVLHHTGNLQRALDHSIACVRPGGSLFIALYNDQGPLSRYWLLVKKTWVAAPVIRPLLVALHAPYILGLVPLVQWWSGRTRLARGMRRWNDMIDWLGGFPFEVARPDATIEKLIAKGFQLARIKTCGGRHGCNEFVFRRFAPQPF